MSLFALYTAKFNLLIPVWALCCTLDLSAIHMRRFIVLIYHTPCVTNRQYLFVAACFVNKKMHASSQSKGVFFDGSNLICADDNLITKWKKLKVPFYNKSRIVNYEYNLWSLKRVFMAIINACTYNLATGKGYWE